MVRSLTLSPLQVMELAETQRPASSQIAKKLSPSQLRTFLDCSARWKFKYIDKLPDRKNSNLALGTAVHEAVGRNFAQKVDTEEDLPVAEVQQHFIDAWAEASADTDFRDQEDPSELALTGERLVHLYMTEVAPGIHPAAVELAVEGEVGGVKVGGRLDLLDVDGTVVDWKVVAQTPKDIDPLHAIQLATYAHITPGANGNIRVDSLVKLKTPKLYQVSRPLDEDDMRAPVLQYPLAQAAMRSGHYLPNRGSNLCSRRNCPFWRACQDEFGGKVAEA